MVAILPARRPRRNPAPQPRETPRGGHKDAAPRSRRSGMLNMHLRLRAPLSLAFGLSLIVATGTAVQAHPRPALQVPGPVAIPADYAGRNPAAPTGIPR